MYIDMAIICICILHTYVHNNRNCIRIQIVVYGYMTDTYGYRSLCTDIDNIRIVYDIDNVRVRRTVY